MRWPTVQPGERVRMTLVRCRWERVLGYLLLISGTAHLIVFLADPSFNEWGRVLADGFMGCFFIGRLVWVSKVKP